MKNSNENIKDFWYYEIICTILDLNFDSINFWKTLGKSSSHLTFSSHKMGKSPTRFLMKLKMRKFK